MKILNFEVINAEEHLIFQQIIRFPSFDILVVIFTRPIPHYNRLCVYIHRNLKLGNKKVNEERIRLPARPHL